MRHLQQLGAAVREHLGGRTVWNVSSAVSGGGIAELLAVDVGYARGAGVDARWLVLAADQPDFYAITRRLHLRMHGTAGDEGVLGSVEQRTYDTALVADTAELEARVQPDDVVILHDPQTAGLLPAVVRRGAVPVWRSHIGCDQANAHTHQAWTFLRRYFTRDTYIVISRQQYAQPWMDPARLHVIAPAVDPHAAKNQPLDSTRIADLLTGADLVAFDAADRSQDTELSSECVAPPRAVTVREGPALASSAPLVVQISRWDRLKDMPGVLRGFAEHVAGTPQGAEAHLMLLGPVTSGIRDDPTGAAVLDECVEVWRALPRATRQQVTLASLPTDDIEANALTVNALQRHATVVVQKSLAEGFGLTAAEAMWKARPVLASASGGLQDQVIDGVTGLLLADPADLGAFGVKLRELLGDPDHARFLGAAAQAHVRNHFLPDRQLRQWGQLMLSL